MDTEAKIDQILKIVTMTQQDLATLKRDFQELKEQDVAELKERVASLERSVMLIEDRHGDQLSALFDARQANEDAHERIEQSIANLKSEIQGILLSHEKRISKLEGNLVPSF